MKAERPYRALACLIAGLALAAAATPPHLQTELEARVQDAHAYTQAHPQVTLAEAITRLDAQAASRGATDAIRREFAARLAAVRFEHDPFRIVVMLNGDAPVADRFVGVGGLVVPIQFQTGALSTRAQVLAAIAAHQAELRAQLKDAPGLGVDPATGGLLVVLTKAEAARQDLATLGPKLEAIAGVPVRLRALGRDMDTQVDGGARVAGPDPDGKRFACTSGFVVTDGAQTAISTAAHCPDTLTYVDPGGERIELGYLSQWGARFQDVQIHPTDRATRPYFYADTDKTVQRTVTTWINRQSLRTGDWLCHRGERTGYSCADVELTDYAPPGDLCGGPCTADWVTVAGPGCKSGDSGGPVFIGTAAVGLVKGASYSAEGKCYFFFFMSTDYLPTGWRLLTGGRGPPVLPVAPPAKAETPAR